MFRSPHVSSPRQHDPYSCMSPSYLGDYSLSYGQDSSSIPPTSLPDLYYGYDEYGLDSSASSSETPPSVQTPLSSNWDFTETTPASTLTYHSNAAMGLTGTDMTSCGECPAMNEQSGAYYMIPQLSEESLPHPQQVDCPLGTNFFVSPADTLLNPWVPFPLTFPTPPLPSSPKLYQPRPSRRIPIVNLDQLASSYETFLPNSQESDRFRSESSSPCAPFRPKQVSTLSFDPIDKQGPSNQRLILCPCGCMEYYRLQ